MEHKEHVHDVFIQHRDEIVELFPIDFHNASELAHENIVSRGETDTPDYKTFLAVVIPGCHHCAASPELKNLLETVSDPDSHGYLSGK
jgi:hypothetical protein